MRALPLLILLGAAAWMARTVCDAYAAVPAAPATPAKPGKPKTAVPPADGDTLSRIRALIGDAACTDAGQCHTLAIGARPCGGPQAYLAWSSACTDGAALAELAAQFKREREAALAASGEMSDCRFLPDPGATCHAGTCRLNQAGPNGQPAV